MSADHEHPVAYWRHRRHITQVELARRVGVHAVNMSRIEHWHSEPGIRLALRIAEALDVPVTDLWTPDGSLPEAYRDERREADVRRRQAAERMMETLAGLREYNQP